MIGERNIYSVSDVNRYIKSVISQDENLKFISVRGELSNFKKGANGHLYFSLKDKESLINCAMFSTYSSRLTFEPKDGDEVVVMASVDVYTARGSYQLIVYEMNSIGLGEQLVKLEMLKKALAKEGLFDESRKRDINIYPNAIGVITAKNGAAVRDIVTNIKRRYPICDIYVFPSAVQGADAPKELLEAFNKSQQYDLDTLIIGRGGGASEDLSAFNDEKLVRAIANSKMPVIAAVGHEIDITLVDYVADKRASTPTGAAELATVDMREIQQMFQYSLDTMKDAIYGQVQDMKDDVSSLNEELNEAIKDKIDYLSRDLKAKKDQLEALNPKKVLSRGYSISSSKDGKIISSVKDIKEGQEIITTVKDGTIISTVESVEE
jgi:exodeoxyribonuclease VII large subunit